MNGNWLRVTPAELRRALDDLSWADEHAEQLVEAEDARWSGSGPTWHVLDFLLERRGFPVLLALGEEAFVEEADEDDESSDWGYGPPRYLTPEHVATAATALSGLTEDDLLAGVTPDLLERAELYPNHWSDEADLRWAVHFLPDARRFFAAAAEAGDAVICWLD